MAEYLLVDGHSVIFAWPELRALHVRRMGAAREALVRALTDYQDHSGIRVVLVFDGQGKAVTEDQEGRDGIQIFYARANQTADAIIERLVARYAASHRLMVATSDSMEQQTALSFGAAGIMSAEGLRGVLDAAGREFERRAAGYRRGK